MLQVGIISSPTILREGLVALVLDQIGGHVQVWDDTADLGPGGEADVFVVDVETMGLPAILTALARWGVEPRTVLVVRDVLTPREAAELLALNVGGLVTPRDRPVEVAARIAAVARGDWRTGRRPLFDAVEAVGRRKGGGERFSRREEEVLHLIASGFSNERIAADLHLSHGSVRNVASAIYRKAGVHTRAEAVLWAWQQDEGERGVGDSVTRVMLFRDGRNDVDEDSGV